LTAKEIFELLHIRASEILDRGNLMRDTHQPEAARADWYAAGLLGEIIAEIKKRDPGIDQ
jgi:hypothetical protein